MREHGLARAGLAGQHVQAGRQAQLRLLDQQQVLDAQLLQHAAGLAAHADGSRDPPIYESVQPAAGASGAHLPAGGRGGIIGDRRARGTDTSAAVHSSANGMAASDPDPHSDPPLDAGRAACRPAALRERLDEEIDRAERHGTR